MGKVRGCRCILFILMGLLVLGAARICFAKTEDEKNNIVIYRRVGPGVVNITSMVVQWDFFFNPIPQEGAGSGSIIDAEGHILTNHYVIRDPRKLEVTLSDGSKWSARLVGVDPDNDLAVIKVDVLKGKLTVIPMGDSTELQIGQKVLAIGNPFGS